MQIDEFLDLARKRRSIRRFRPDPIPAEYIEKILEAGRWAMSGANAQPWEFIVVKDEETKKKLGEAYLWHAEASVTVDLSRKPEYFHPEYSPTQPKDVSRSVLWSYAPVIIAVLGDPRTLQASTMYARYFDEPTFYLNLANATHMMQLAAAALGVGAEWVSIIQPLSEMMKPLLGIPPVMRVFTLVPIGYPAQQPTPYRRELNELVHYEKYDMSKFRSGDDIQEFIKYLRRRHAEARAYPGRK